MKHFLFYTLVFTFLTMQSQPNCEAFRYYGDTTKYEACKKSMEIRGKYQFSREYQSILDAALQIDSTFDYAYWAKSIAYLKSGDFLQWKRLIDKAVHYNPLAHLAYRGWCRYQFFRDYKGLIEDVEKLDSLVDYDIGYSQNGVYHLNIAKGLCYKKIGKTNQAIGILEKQIKRNEQDDFLGAYDYLHLGVMYLETEQYQKALTCFEKQSDHNPLAEKQYYLALTYKKLWRLKEYRTALDKAKELYRSGQRMSDPYSNPIDKIYLEDIEKEQGKGL